MLKLPNYILVVSSCILYQEGFKVYWKENVLLEKPPSSRALSGAL